MTEYEKHLKQTEYIDQHGLWMSFMHSELDAETYLKRLKWRHEQSLDQYSERGRMYIVEQIKEIDTLL